MNTKLKFMVRSVMLFLMLLAGSVQATKAEGTLVKDAYIYFDTHGSTNPDVNWSNDGAKVTAVFFVGEASHQVAMDGPENGTTIWKAQVPVAGVNKIKFLRINPAQSGGTWNNTKVIDVDSYNNCYYATSWSDASNEGGIASKSYGERYFTIWYAIGQTDTWQAATLSDRSTTINLPEGDSYFNVNNGVTAWGNTTTITRSNSTDISLNSDVLGGGSSCKITADVAGDYVFNLSEDGTKISVTYPSNVTPEPSTRTIYFYNWNGYQDVYCYVYKTGSDPVEDNGGWPGVKMTEVGNRIYKYEVPDGLNQIIFNNGKEGDENKKVGDVPLVAESNFYTHKDAEGGAKWMWDTFTEPVPPAKLPTTKTIYFYNKDNWSNVRCHAWNSTTNENNGGWPGIMMMEVGDGVYKYDVPDTYNMVIFSGNAGENKTSDNGSNIRSGSNNFYTFENGVWKWTMYYAEPGLKYNHVGDEGLEGDECFIPFDASGKVTLTFTKDMQTTFSVFYGKDEYKASSATSFARNAGPVTLEAAASGVCTVTADETGDYVFTYDKENHTISVEYPFANDVLPTQKKESGKIAFISKQRVEGDERSQVVRSGWFWYSGQAGITHHMVLGGKYDGKTISYYDNKFGFSNCLPLANSAEDNHDSWIEGIYYKLTSNGKRDGDGDVLKNEEVSYTDNIMFYTITERISVPDDDTHEPVNSGKFGAFTHLTAKVTSNNESVLKGAPVTLSVSDAAGTLSVASANNYIVYAVNNSTGAVQRLHIGNASADGKVTFTAPATAGQYKMHVFVQDPYGFELIEPYEEPITLIVNEQTYKVTYAKGDSDGGVVPVDNNAYLSGAEAIVLGNTGKLTKAGYNFIGWNTAADGSGTSYPVGSSITLGTEDVTLYPQWVDQKVAAISANYPSGTNFHSATDVVFTVTDATDVTYKVNGGDPQTATATGFTYNVTEDVTIEVTATSVDGIETTRVFKYTVGNVDEGAYYLVSPTLTGGKKLEQYKFNNVLHRDADNNVDQNLLTLSVSDFMMRDLSNPANPGTAELADGTTFEYWIEKGDGTVVYYPKGGDIPGSIYYPGFNEEGKKYVYVYNTQFPKDHQMYVSVNGGKEQPMTYVANATADGHTGYWCYELGTDASYEVTVNDYGIPYEAQADLKSHTFTVTTPTQIVLSEWGKYDKDFDHFNVVTSKTSTDNSTDVPAGDFALGFEEEKWFDAGKLVDNPSAHTFVYTKTQTEAYSVSCNATKNPADVPAEDERFTLTKTAEQKSYTWYLNLGAEPYDNSEHFTIPSNGVAIAINNSIDDLHAIKEVKSDGKYSYSLIGNTTKDSKNWADPATSKLEMQRIGFKDGKSFLYPDDDSSVACDSIVYTITITKPAGIDEWPKLFMAFTDQNTIDNFQQTDQWYQTPIRPQVFDNKDANVYFGGLEWNGVNTGENSYVNEIGKPTDQTITPKDIDQFTSFVLHVNVTNATYWIAFNGETDNPEDGFFICGPAVADADYKNWTKKIKGENLDKSHNPAIHGNAVRMTYDAATESYVATLNLTNGEKFRFLDTSWDKAYYEEDAILPARDGEPGDADWKAAKTWETDYFNNTTNALTSTEVDNNGAITFKLDTGEYTVRFYFKKIKTATGSGSTEVFTYDATPYYTIDYHIGIGDAAAFGTDINKGAGSAFAFHKTWSSRLAYVNNGLDAYYVNGWNWTKEEQKNTATASVTLKQMEKPAYLAAGMPMILTDVAKNESKLYVIVPGDPYGLQSTVKACYRENTGTNITVRPIFETENYTTGMNADKNSEAWKEWSNMVGPGAFDGEKYTTRNFTFAMIVPTWNTAGKKELDFWRVKSTNNKMTGHKFLVVATVPDGTDDLESGKAFGSYESGAKAMSMANYMTISIEGDEDNTITDIQNVESAEETHNNGRIYNLMGVEVKTPVRGQVYIVNGRKIIMK